MWLLPQSVQHSSWPQMQCQGIEEIRQPLPKLHASCTGWCLRETCPHQKESLGEGYCSKASFCTWMSAEMEIIFNHILRDERMFENLIFLATLNWASTISAHKLPKKTQKNQKPNPNQQTKNSSSSYCSCNSTKRKTQARMAFIPCVRKSFDLSRAITALHQLFPAMCPGMSMQHCPAARAATPSHISPAAHNSDGWF